MPCSDSQVISASNWVPAGTSTNPDGVADTRGAAPTDNVNANSTTLISHAVPDWILRLMTGSPFPESRLTNEPDPETNGTLTGI